MRIGNCWTYTERKTHKEEMSVSMGEERREKSVCKGVVPPLPVQYMVILNLMLSPIVLLSLLKVIVFVCVCGGGDGLLNERKGLGVSFLYSKLTAAGGPDRLC